MSSAGGGLFGMQPMGGPFGVAPPWKQPSTPDEAIDAMKQFMESMPRLIVCGRLGLDPLTETQRRDILAGVNLYNAVETVADFQSRWDVAFTTTQRPDLVEQ
ncbi:hypothetical protein ACN27E_17920 [Mycobacterium sp. WMMD1722]|uniref:hypothetical protein n=1 Tax=Mycobacterium sp. WMMD1722 TaxID=3404117 RepID=UPI003BF59E13